MFAKNTRHLFSLLYIGLLLLILGLVGYSSRIPGRTYKEYKISENDIRFSFEYPEGFTEEVSDFTSEFF